MIPDQVISPSSYNKLDALAKRHVPCPACGAGKGDYCHDPTSHGVSEKAANVHAERIDRFVAMVPHVLDTAAEQSMEVDDLKVEQRRRERQIRLLRSRARDVGRSPDLFESGQNSAG